MQVTLRQIGNSRGVIIPSVMIEQLHIDNAVEMFIKDGTLHLKPIYKSRQGWFDHYDPNQDDVPLANMKTLESEQEDWEW